MSFSNSLPTTVETAVFKGGSSRSINSANKNSLSSDSLSERLRVGNHVKKRLLNIVSVIQKRRHIQRRKRDEDNITIQMLTRHSQDVDMLKNDMSSLAVYEHENIYRGLMNSLLHPLGTPEGTVGLRPGDLLDHLREVFDVEREDHEAFIREEMSNRPTNLQVNVTILEANGLRGPDFTEDTCDSFCMICLHNPAKGRSVSPRVSPRPTPSSSPNLQQKTQLEAEAPDTDTQKTSISRNTSHPKWNDKFQMEIDDFLTDEVHVFVFNQDLPASAWKEGKHNTLKNFLQVKKSPSIESDIPGCIGKVVIPVQNISTMGSDDWYDIVALSTNKGKPGKPVGKCHLRLGISYIQDGDGSSYFSTEDYYKAFKRFLNYSYSESCRNPNDQFGLLSLKAHRILKMFAEGHSISKLSQAIVNVTCLLEIHCERDGAEMSEFHINTGLDDLRMTWATMQIGQKNILERMPLTDTELTNYRRVASQFIQQKCEKVVDLPNLFPPTAENVNILKADLGITIQLLGLDLWEPKCAPQNQISKQVLERLQEDVLQWVEVEGEKIPETSLEIKDKVIPEMQRLIDLVNILTSHCTILPVNKQFYTSLGVNYYKAAYLAIEKKISSLSMATIEKMNKYKRRYTNYSVNIMAASKLTLRLYFALCNLSNVIRDNVTRRELFRLNIFKYQEWFEESMIYWLQTFRTECFNRLEKSLEIEKDVVVATCLVKYSHSSVDVLSCFAQVIGEWKKIDFRDADCSMMGVTKVTDIICDGARMYADKLQSIVERNCYFDDNLNTDFGVKDRLCITINNIEHVRLYLVQLPNLLSWDAVVTTLSISHNSDSVGASAMATLHRLIDTSNGEILMKNSQLLHQIAGKMQADMEKYMDIFTRKEPLKASSVDRFLEYVSTNMETLNEQLMPDIYPYMIEQVWNVIVQSLEKQMLIGQKREYYDQMKHHLRALGSFFQRAGLPDKKFHSELYDSFRHCLDLNSKKSADLMLLYFKELATDMTTPPECYGHLAFKAAYIEETRGNMTIFVTILRGSDLPGLDSSGYSDPYVEVSLQPQVLFPWCRPQRTPVIKQTLNPVFNVTYQFPNISKDNLNIQGSCILLSVYDYDTIGWDDFAGEIVVNIPSLEKISENNSMHKIPAIIMPLKRPKKPFHGPFRILSQREWEKSSKTFVSNRLKFIDHQPTRTDKQHNEKGFFSSFFSNMFN